MTGHGILRPPQPLVAAHDSSGFSCGEAALDDWLKRRAVKAQDSRSARTYVVADGTEVVGYYCLSMGAVARDLAPGRLRRNAPDPLPVAILGRLAVRLDHSGMGIGRGLLRDAMLRTLRISNSVGCMALLVHAIDERAADFYRKHGFIAYPAGRRTLFLSVKTMEDAL